MTADTNKTLPQAVASVAVLAEQLYELNSPVVLGGRESCNCITCRLWRELGLALEVWKMQRGREEDDD